MNKIIDKINNIFRDLPTEIKKAYPTNYRENKITIQDLILYTMSYTSEKVTKSSIVSSINYDNSKLIDRSSFSKRLKKIPMIVFKNLFDKIRLMYDEIHKPSDMSLISVDGTNNITTINCKPGEIEVALNMGFFDIDRNVPIELVFNGSEKRNCESSQLKKYIEDGKLKNAIIVADRAYCDYNLINFIHTNNLKYVIRIRDNSKLHTTGTKLAGAVANITKNSRHIEYDKKCKKTITYKNGVKKEITVKGHYRLLTNLMDKNEYTDEKIHDIYKSRWTIETFFGFLKSNFRFSILTEKTKDECSKLIYSELIITYLVKLIAYQYNKTCTDKPKSVINKRTNKKTVKKSVVGVVKINESQMVKGLMDKLLKVIIHGNLTEDIMDNYTKSYICFHKNEPDRIFERKSIYPFKKWYVKKYFSIYKYRTMIDAIENGNVDKLDKNLKMLSKNIDIT